MQTKDEKGTAHHLTHPGREEWMTHLYGEASPAEQARLAAHLKGCADCRAEAGRWQSAMTALDEYKLPRHRATRRPPQTILKWGIAAGLVLAFAFGTGRLFSPASAAPAAARAQLKSEIRAELLAELGRLQQQQLEDNKVILAAIARVDEDRLADYASLRKDLETMAVLTQDSFQQTHQEMATLAGFSQPEARPVDQ